jgi:hypothetical protein
MKRMVGGLLALLLALPMLAAEEKPKDKPQTPEEQYKALLKEYADEMKAFQDAYSAAKTQEDKNKVFQEKYPKPDKLAPKFVELADKNPKEPVALDALTWVVNNNRGGGGKDSPQTKAVALLLRDHVQSPKMGPLCQGLANGFDKEGTDLLRAVLEKNPDKDVQAEASLALAQRLSMRVRIIPILKERPELTKSYEQFYGKELVEELQKADPAKAEAESARLFNEFAEKYAAQMKPERLTQLCQTLGRMGGGEQLLRTLMEKDTRRDVQGVACLGLAQALKARADQMPNTKADEAEKVRKESEQLFDRAIEKYGDVKAGFRGTIEKMAKPELFELRNLSVGKVVPEVEGEDADSKKFKLSDYRGKVVLIDFWGDW